MREKNSLDKGCDIDDDDIRRAENPMERRSVGWMDIGVPFPLISLPGHTRSHRWELYQQTASIQAATKRWMERKSMMARG